MDVLLVTLAATSFLQFVSDARRGAYMKCLKCGSENESDAKYCSVCGVPITNETPPPMESRDATHETVDDNGFCSQSLKDETRASEFGQETPVGDADKKKGDSIKANLKFFFVSCLKYLGVIVVAFAVAVACYLMSAPNSFINEWTESQSIEYVSILVMLGIPLLIVLIVFACLGAERRAKAKSVLTKKKWMPKAAIALFVLVSAVFIFWPCPHSKWVDATCQHPKYCSACGKEEGDLAEHKWVDATCLRAKHCGICGLEEGEKLEHDWEPATCTKPKTCKLCGEKEGKPIDHTPGDWVDKPDYVKGTVTSTQSCQVCGTELDTKTRNIDSFIENGAFSLPAFDFVKRMSSVFSSISGCKLKADSGLAKDGLTMSIDIKTSSKTVSSGGLIASGTDNTFIPFYEGSKEGSFWNLMITCKSDQNTAEIMYALIQTCDPALSSSEAHDVGTEALDNFTALSSNKGIGQASRNGITYSLAKMSGSWVVTAKVE